MTSPAARPASGARYLLLASTLFLAVGGLLMIFSASSAADFIMLGDSFDHVKSQVLFLALGLVALVVAERFSIRFTRMLGWWVLIGSDLLLVLVLFIGVGKWGATRWLDLGFTTIQPSEFAKLGCVLMAAVIMAEREKHPGRMRDDLLKMLAVVGVPFVLIMMQPDMGTAMSLLLAVFFTVVLGGLPWSYVGGSIIAGIAALPPLIMLKPYRAARFLSFLDPTADAQGAGYQIIQAKIALGSGGLFGLGLGMSRQKFLYLPAAHTDFIFAIIGEELGLLGAASVVAAFAVFTYAGLRIAMSLEDGFARISAGGLTLMVAVQAVINMASVTGLMPVTGVPLPLVSYGGSSMVFTMGCIGLILAMTRVDRRMAANRKPRVIDVEGSAGARSGERRRDGRPHLSGIDGGAARVSRRA